MKVLVMGGTEFVSSSLAKHLIDKGYTVDIFTRGIKEIKYEGIRKHLKGDRKLIEDLERNLLGESYDYVFDISAYVKEDVKKLVKVLKRDNLKRYVFCSSGAVYVPSEEMITEDFTRGENFNWGSYGYDKKEAEDYLFEVCKKEKFPITIFRPTYIYGEENNLYRETYFFDRISEGLDIPIPSGDKRTQFIHISDLVQVFESAVKAEKSIGQAYNVTHPEIVTWNYLVKTAMGIVNRKVNTIEVDEEKENINTREYFPFRNVTYLLATKKAEDHGLYVPKLSLSEGMVLAYNYYSKNKSILKDIRMDKIELVLRKK
ncbi:SDR family oxidoreductase [Clostridium sp. UBA4548]|uniref:SDR family oxidoreductase n=1 Tax=Clostridium sp. UBA4548 TaxID=1946361 RepID=UPI0025C66838|nr:SDR family oxidoreductase [Clostridium sp. UBA4548]